MLQPNQAVDQAKKAFNRQEWREAVNFYRQFVDGKNAEISHKLNYFFALEHAGHPEEARLGYLELSYKHPMNCDVHIEVGLFFQRQRDPQEAVIFLGRALCVQADASGALQALETLGISATGDIDHACVMGGLAGEDAKAGSAGLLTEIAVWPLINSAMAAMRRKQWDKAEVSFRKILKLAPRHVPMLVQLGHSLREQERFTEALAIYRRAILLAPRDPDVYLHLGHTFKGLERYMSALDAYSTALMLRPALYHAQAEFETLERFLQSRGLSKADNAFHRTGAPLPESALPSVMTPPSGLNDRQKTIFNQLANAITFRD